MGDRQFVMTDVNSLTASVKDINERASAVNRDVGIYALFHMIVAESDQAAQEEAQRIVENPDDGALQNILASANLDTNQGGTSDQLKAGLLQGIDDGNLAFMGIPCIYGAPQTVANRIKEIGAQTGVDGMLFSWPDFVQGVRDFGNRVMPLL